MKKYTSLLIFVGTVIVVGIATHGGFFSPRNLSNLSRQVSINGILSVGMTFIILTGGIDLSVGSVVALAGVVAGLIQVNLGYGERGLYGALVAVAGAIGVGLVAGLFNGIFIVRTKVVPFIITLGLMVIARGVALILAKGAMIAPMSETYSYFGTGVIGHTWSAIIVGTISVVGIIWALAARNVLAAILTLVTGGSFLYAFLGYSGAPIPVLLFGGLALVAHFMLQNTVYGRYVIATGSNAEAAFLSGVPVERITMGVYLLMGCLAGLSGAVLTARLDGASPNAGDLFELDAIAAVVIGGTRLSGGVGSISGTVLGAFLIGVLNNGMSLLNIEEFYQKVIKGLIIIVAVWIDTKGRAGKR
ncbi:MAG: inner-membrane translocator [Deltaproteobacteria bacterium]|nr:inner-membrane translocator [Deltaproteobacteria bacterium]